MHIFRNEKTRLHQVKGFTLIELLVVLAILGLIVGLVGPQIMKHLGAAKSDTARLQIEDLGSALDILYLDIGRYPTTDEGLEALIQNSADLDNWNGPYLKKRKIPKDPWGNSYQYQSPGQKGPYDLYTYGADNAPGGEKENHDILSWE
ncbi:MAG: type II secretion system major pseudopilin GspG [Gammaproteobacteria bacterium]|nr:type II secretion system major pseudopilin GspG [Gammaproteobacteria bacterium]